MRGSQSASYRYGHHADRLCRLDQLTWVVSAYFLTQVGCTLLTPARVGINVWIQAGLMLTYGQILTISPSKWV